MLLKTATSVYENRNVLANIMKLKLCTLLEAGPDVLPDTILSD